MRAPLSLILALALATAAPAAAETARTITVTGQGNALAVPDMATILLGVVTEAPNAGEAIGQNSRAMAGVLDRLRALGVAERDMQTSDFSVNPVYQYNQTPGAEPTIRGFTARNMLTLRVRDLARLGEVLDEVARDGANSFGGLNFGMQDPDAAENDARRAAMADARARAELFAGAGGVTLGRVLSISEASFGAPPMPMFARADMAMNESVPVAAGEMQLSASVTVVYEIAE